MVKKKGGKSVHQKAKAPKAKNEASGSGHKSFKDVEKKWQAEWAKSKAFEVKEDSNKKKFYVLEMFPYPSGSGLHMGHAFNYTIGDVYARFKRMQGFNVLHPMGYDSLGLPAENAAIKEGIHPKEYTEKAIENFEEQFRALGISYDWSRKVRTHDPSYYKWDQWIFLQMLKKGIAYRKKAPANYCPKCNTVLANEEVVDGKCWRHKDTTVEIKHLEQWFLKTTAYSEELLKGLDKLDWPERIKDMQRHWIGRSEGTKVLFGLEGSKEKIEIFTTRPDTLYGVTFLVYAAQHPKVAEFVKGTKYEKDYHAFLKKTTTSEKLDADKAKEGFFTGKYAIHPLTHGQVPIFASNFVLADYGTGAVMAVPAHDQRDFEFAKKYKIPIKIVIQPDDRKLDVLKMKEAYEGLGNLVNSGTFNDLNSEEAKIHITKDLEEKGLGGEAVEYKLRDWLLSRQRYWGTPIPVIYCSECGVIPVPEKDLPIELPVKVQFGKGNPLATSKEFVNTTCPKCKRDAKRETDTMSTFVNSSWYFLRYCDPHNVKEIFGKAKAKYWMPIDTYIGGAEHACMHLIYFRFYTMFLGSLGILDFSEPALRLFNQGMVHGSDGFVMSKSRGNGVEPLMIINKFGTDTLRFYLVSSAGPDKDFAWNDAAIEGSHRFVNKVVDYFGKVKVGKSGAKSESRINKAVKDITEEIESFRYNMTLIKLRQLIENFSEEESKETLEKYLKLLHPFCPHISEELWHNLGNKNLLSLERWPSADEKKIDEKLEQADKDVEKAIEDTKNILKIIKEKSGKEPNKVYLYILPNELAYYDSGIIGQRLQKETYVSAVNDKKKYDPQNKAGKARPGRPAVYVE